jgi:hypothetical protein
MFHNGTAIKRIDITVGKHSQAAIAKQWTDKIAQPGKNTTSYENVIAARSLNMYRSVLHLG